MQFQDADLLLLDNIFNDVTTFLPPKEVDKVRKTISLIADKNNLAVIPENENKIAAILRPYYLEMCKRKNKQGGNYSKTNLFWLFEWAASGEIPVQQNAPKDDIKKRYKPVHDYVE